MYLIRQASDAWLQLCLLHPIPRRWNGFDCRMCFDVESPYKGVLDKKSQEDGRNVIRSKNLLKSDRRYLRAVRVNVLLSNGFELLLNIAIKERPLPYISGFHETDLYQPTALSNCRSKLSCHDPRNRHDEMCNWPALLERLNTNVGGDQDESFKWWTWKNNVRNLGMSSIDGDKADFIQLPPP